MKIIEDFIKCKSEYSDFCDKLNHLLNSILQTHGVKAHQIVTRVKDVDSLRKKIEGKGAKYTKVTDITDLAGIRIITYFEDEVDLIAQIIQDEFIIDRKHSIDKRKIDIDRFGYKSLHYIVQISKSRNKLLEYKRFKNFSAEIQIRSILQHSWAEIEHDLGYKSKSAIPDVAKRSFYRISALLEVADIEFVNLKKLLSSYKEEIKVQITDFPNKLQLDQDTLLEFISSSQLFQDLEAEIQSVSKKPVTGTYGELSIAIETFNTCGIQTIEDLSNKLKEYSKILIGYEKIVSSSYDGLGKANAIHSLAVVLQIENNLKEMYEDNYSEMNSFEEAKSILKSVIEACNVKKGA